MDKLKTIKIKYQDGTYSNEIPIGVSIDNIDYNDTKTLKQVLGDLDINKGTVEERLTQSETKVDNAVSKASLAETKADVVDARLDNIIIESGTSEAETVAARTNSDGQTFNTLGDRLDTQFGEIKEDLSDLSGLSEDVKQALLACFARVAWTDEHGQNYYDALEDALYPPTNLVSISAVYTQSGTVYTTDNLDVLKPDLIVTANYSDSTSSVVTGYALSGTLTEGTSTVTVSYGGKTTAFSVTCAVKGWLYRFNQSLLSSGSEDFGLVGNAVYAAGRNGTDYAYSHIIPTSGTASSDTQLGLKATNISRFPDFDGDFTISYWFATQIQMYQHPFYFTGAVSDDPTQYSVSNIVVTNGWTAVNEKGGKGFAGIGMQGSTSALFLRITCTDTIYGSRIKLTAPNGFDSTQWHHYAITRQGTTVRMFIDGALIVSATLVMSTIYKSNQLALVSLFNSSSNTDDIQQIGNGGKMQDFYVAEFCKWSNSFDPSAISY